MFFKMLKKDLKKSKTMNIIIAFLITLSAALIASSTNLILASSSAVETFLDKANPPDFTIIKFDSEAENIRLENFLNESDDVTSYKSETNILLSLSDFILESDDVSFTTTTVLSKIPETYGLVSDIDGNPITLSNDEISCTQITLDTLGVEVGDNITIKIAGVPKTFTIKCLASDALYGTASIGYKRIFVSDHIFDSGVTEDATKLLIYSVEVNDVTSFNNSFLYENFTVISTIYDYTFSTVYIYDKIIAYIFAAVSVFLIIIALMALRFTIVFSISEEYREIGVMKAIGIKNNKIKQIYLFKYFFISVISGIIGLILAIPLYNLLLKVYPTSIVIYSSVLYNIISAFTVVIIIGIIVLFCYLSTKSIDRLSAIDAIRSGKSSENFGKRRKIMLSKCRKMKTSTILAVSDIFSNLRRFLILATTFVIGTFLVVMPILATDTLKSDKMGVLMGYPDFDFIVYDYSLIGGFDSNAPYEHASDYEDKSSAIGIETSVYSEATFNVVMCTSNGDYSSLYCRKPYGKSITDYPLYEGDYPILENEICITATVAKRTGVKIGDTVTCNIEGDEESYIVTGTFQSMYNLGNGIIFSDAKVVSPSSWISITLFGLFINETLDKDKVIEDMNIAMPDLVITSKNEMISSIFGSIIDSLDQMKYGILSFISFIIMLITVLLSKMLIGKEEGDIAIIKSMGIKESTINLWHLKRLLIIVSISIIIGLAIAYPVTSFLLSIIFNIMGATSITPAVNFLELLVLAPAVMIVSVILANLLGMRQVSKISPMQINNQE